MSIKDKLSNSLQYIAMSTVKNTVGKSFPIFTHEIKVPEEVQKWLKKKEDDRNQI